MTPEQAWQAALGQLQMEMPKTTFDTWVRDTRFLDYEDGVLILGFHNSYARDWVENRLCSMLRRILMGILGHDIELRFEVLPLRQTHDQQSDRHHEEAESQDEEAQMPEPEPNDEMYVHLDTARQSLYEDIVQPERVTVVPGYFLRWIPYLGHQKSWMVVALWQAFYQNFGKKVVAGKTFSISGAEIARWSGLSRRTVVTHLNDLSDLSNDNLLSWFIDRIDPHQRWGENTGLTSQFCFRLAMPLTPGDARHFTEVLLNLGIRENPIHALKKTLELQPKELLPFPAPIPEKADNLPLLKPRSVQQIILETSGITPQSLAYPEIVKLVGELAGRIMPPKDVLVLSHYYLLHWLPLLGSGPAWLVALLRDEGYYDRKTGELRDKIRLDDGYVRLAAALGIERENTIGDWLPTPIKRTGSQQVKSQGRQERREMTRRYVAQFLHKTDYFIDHSGKQKTIWDLQIKLNEPLTPEHREIHDGLLKVLRQTIVTGEEARLKSLLDGQAANEELEGKEDEFRASYDANCTGPKPVRTRSSQGLPRDLHKSKEGQDANFIGSSRVLHRSNRESQREFHTLKHLINKHFQKARISFLEVLTTALRTANENNPEKAAGGLNSANEEGDLWNFDRLLELDGTTERRRREICKTIAVRPVLGQRLLAWLLYAYEHHKTGNRKSGIESPFGYALSRYQKLIPTSEYVALAGFSPDELYALLNSPYREWEVKKPTMRIVQALIENGFMELLCEYCGKKV